MAGTAVTILTHWIINKSNEKQNTKNLKFEFELNIGRIEKWLEEIQQFRNAVNADDLNQYYGYFDLSLAVSITANDLYQSGLLYKYLNYEDIARLQVIFADLSITGEQVLNQRIQQLKEDFNKADANLSINFWENKFKEHRKTLNELSKKLSV